MRDVSLETLQAAQSGDLDAYRTFVEAYEGPIHHTTHRLVGSRFRADVEDMVQEIFIKLFRALPLFEPERGTKFSSWVFTFVKNYCFDVLKRRRLPTVSMEGLAPEGMLDLPSGIRNPAEELIGDEVQAEISHAVDRLPDDQRLAFVLREYQGLSYAQIAEISGCSDGTVKSRIHRAKEALRQRLRPLIMES
jgi:RNA polymerase sigma-70 factor (ECF subfamily)